ncbi:hypothetical protein VTI74DRAFT_7190 [Chaetomium olivicolor]
MQPARRVLVRNPPGASAVRSAVPGAYLPPQRRLLSRSAPHHNAASVAPPAAPSPSGLAPLPSRKLLSLRGPDAARFLQGVITANLFPGHHGAPPPSDANNNARLRADAGFYAAFLTAQGRVLHDVFVYRDPRDVEGREHGHGTSWLIEVDAGEAERLQRHVKRYKLRAKFDVRILEEGEGQVWGAWGDGAGEVLGKGSEEGVVAVQDTRAPGLGWRVLGFGGKEPAELGDKVPRVGEDVYRLRRYLYGVPEGQGEILREQALTHESNIDLMGGVDFRKGCYVGQELTIRTEHRGVVRKRILPCVLYPEEQAEPKGLEYRPELGGGLSAEMVPAEASIGRVGKKGRSAGKWLRGVGNVGLALCRLEIMTDVVLPGEAASVAYTAGDEFVVGLGAKEGEEGEGDTRKVKIKAFVPEWLRQGLENKEGH